MSHADESRIIDACVLAHELSAMCGVCISKNNNIERLVRGVLLLERHAIAATDLLDALKSLLCDYDQLIGDGVINSNQPECRQKAAEAIEKFEASK